MEQTRMERFRIWLTVSAYSLCGLAALLLMLLISVMIG